MLTGRGLYHPVPIKADFIRKNAFELIVEGGFVNNPMSIFCKNITMTLPKTNTVDIPWIGGIMRVAGRTSQPYSINTSFIVAKKGTENSVSRDTLQELYEWRNKVFDHDTGQIQLADNYKKTANLLIYDVTTEELVYDFQVEGIWPSDIQDITFAVEDDAVLEISAVFAADKIQMLKTAY